MNYSTLIRKLEQCGYQFQQKYGFLEAATQEPPRVNITHRYPGKKAGASQNLQGYITCISLPNQPPEETRLYWCTKFYTGSDGIKFPIGSDWGQLRHITRCSLAIKDLQLKKR